MADEAASGWDLLQLLCCNLASGAAEATRKVCMLANCSSNESRSRDHEGNGFPQAIDQSFGKRTSTMIENEIKEIIQDQSSVRRAKRFSALVDQFRGGRDVGDLLVLLESTSDKVLGLAAHIVGEIAIDPASAPPIVAKLRELTAHESPTVRAYALTALFPWLKSLDQETRELLARMSRDPEEGVRSLAQMASRRISSS
ncbi:hypothetical protein FGO68_gene3985 [Halteria grandinella]|uniref:HEAT repeat domain-containing protein n=1 Tax=Halteria grandinella TaxID=5974 RepID=A0A8J8NI78_HALGN|nr:hypothetical protein FGO68_gene3985 [Halteria grandinella]